MNTQPDLVESIAADEELVFDFFVRFSRLECALKRAGFVKSGPHRNAIPDWKSFADTLCGRMNSVRDADFTKAKSFLVSAPPQKQIFVSPKGMRWSANPRRQDETEARYLLRLVCDVRNNLFHGGKYAESQGGPIDGNALRNKRLLQACLTILDTCRSLDAKVEDVFAEAA